MTQPDWTVLTPDLRATVERYLSIPQMQSMNGPFGGASKFTLAAYDRAIEDKDAEALLEILSDVWLRAPELRQVYADPGFRLLSSILDGGVGDFV